MSFVHFDEARRAAITQLRAWTKTQSNVSQSLLIVDLYGKIRAVLWGDFSIDSSTLMTALQSKCGPWWTNDIFTDKNLAKGALKVFENAWNEAKQDASEPKLRILDRHRSRTAWFSKPIKAIWEVKKKSPPVLVFFSFKGGLGRTTLLSSFAIQRARRGHRVCVLDFDFDSPGAGRLLSADTSGLTAQWGIVDFLLERDQKSAPLQDYFHRCDRISSTGEVIVFPSGKLDEDYTDKLSRIDLEELPAAENSGISVLLNRIRSELSPDWILIDARTGISEPAGLLLSGLAHLHVLLGSTSDQNWQGLRLVLDRLGKEKILADHPQSEVLLVQALVPPGEAGKTAELKFAKISEYEFDTRYYAEVNSNEESDKFWNLGDKEDEDAPHVPFSIDYDLKLATFDDISEVSDVLCEGKFAKIDERIATRFLSEEEDA
jgi:cellulose biosynthesis protein BcsQ